MSSYAKTMLLGRVGQDPFATGEDKKSFASISVAINKPGKSQDGEPYAPDWFDVVFFNNLANVVKEYVKKGDLIFIEARPENHEYKDREGQVHKTFRFVANELRLLNNNKEN